MKSVNPPPKKKKNYESIEIEDDTGFIPYSSKNVVVIIGYEKDSLLKIRFTASIFLNVVISYCI